MSFKYNKFNNITKKELNEIFFIILTQFLGSLFKLCLKSNSLITFLFNKIYKIHNQITFIQFKIRILDDVFF